MTPKNLWPVVRMNRAGAAQHPLGHEGMTFAVERFIPHRLNPGEYIVLIRDYRFPSDSVEDGPLAFTCFQLQPSEYELITV